MAVTLTPPPLQSPIAGPDGKVPSTFPAWTTWFQKVFILAGASAQSGTTAQRPTQGLYPGRRYFDTSLGANGKPIFVGKTGAGWVDAAGTTV